VDDTRHARTQRLKPWLGRFDDEVATACTGLPPTGSARARLARFPNAEVRSVELVTSCSPSYATPVRSASAVPVWKGL